MVWDRTSPTFPLVLGERRGVPRIVLGLSTSRASIVSPRVVSVSLSLETLQPPLSPPQVDPQLLRPSHGVFTPTETPPNLSPTEVNTSPTTLYPLRALFQFGEVVVVSK